MKRKWIKRCAVGLSALLIVLLVIVRDLRAPSLPASRRGGEQLQKSIEAVVTNPVQFAKSHISGGIGAVLATDTATGALSVAEVMAGSPAELAGLREGDIILTVDGVATKGRTLGANVESIRGYAWGSVTLAIQRGSTNLQCVLHRASWNGMGLQNMVNPNPNPAMPKVTTTNPRPPAVVITNRQN